MVEHIDLVNVDAYMEREIQIDRHRLKDWPLEKLLTGVCQNAWQRFLWHESSESVFLGLNLLYVFWYIWRGLSFFCCTSCLSNILDSSMVSLFSSFFLYPHAIYFRGLMLSCCFHQRLPWPLQISFPTTHSRNFCHFIIQATLIASHAEPKGVMALWMLSISINWAYFIHYSY